MAKFRRPSGKGCAEDGFRANEREIATSNGSDLDRVTDDN
jgi:hypothetical protein